jgi:hypothetical protein
VGQLLTLIAPLAQARPLVIFRHDERLADGAVEAEIVAGSFGVHWLNRRVAPDHAVPHRSRVAGGKRAGLSQTRDVHVILRTAPKSGLARLSRIGFARLRRCFPRERRIAGCGARRGGPFFSNPLKQFDPSGKFFDIVRLNEAIGSLLHDRR